MASLMRCDGCDAEERTTSLPMNWLRVQEQVRPVDLPHGDMGRNAGGDYCSWKCLAEAAALLR